MPCPHLKEVVMLFCQAYPVKKMVPLDRLASADPCVGGDFQHCPAFQELSAQLKACADRNPAQPAAPAEPSKAGRNDAALPPTPSPQSTRPARSGRAGSGDGMPAPPRCFTNPAADARCTQRACDGLIIPLTSGTLAWRLLPARCSRPDWWRHAKEGSMRRKALLVGINHYPDAGNNLKGCVNDVLQVSRMLQEGFGFNDVRQIRLLTDERATTAAIKDRLRWLLDGADAGDVLVFHYSGHGAQVRDRHGDELDDGLDEIICPYDLDWDDPFTDDQLYQCLEGLKPGVCLTVVLDCCHSGTGLREFGPGVTLPSRRKCLDAPPDILHRTGPAIQDLGPARRLTMTRAGTELPLRGSGGVQPRLARFWWPRAAQTRSRPMPGLTATTTGRSPTICARQSRRRVTGVCYADLLKRTRRLLAANRFEQLPQLEGPRDAAVQPVFMPIVTDAAVA